MSSVCPDIAPGRLSAGCGDGRRGTERRPRRGRPGRTHGGSHSRSGTPPASQKRRVRVGAPVVLRRPRVEGQVDTWRHTRTRSVAEVETAPATLQLRREGPSRRRRLESSTPQGEGKEWGSSGLRESPPPPPSSVHRPPTGLRKPFGGLSVAGVVSKPTTYTPVDPEPWQVRFGKSWSSEWENLRTSAS